MSRLQSWYSSMHKDPPQSRQVIPVFLGGQSNGQRATLRGGSCKLSSINLSRVSSDMNFSDRSRSVNDKIRHPAHIVCQKNFLVWIGEQIFDHIE